MKSLNHLSRRYVSVLCAIALMATSFAHAFAQQPATAKRAITHKDYDTWHSIQSPQISRDGKFVAYAYMAQDEDSEIVARNIATGQEWRAPRGYRPPAPPPDDSIPNFGELIAAQGLTFPRDPKDLLGNFWPEEESIDDFLSAMREWRGHAKTDPAA